VPREHGFALRATLGEQAVVVAPQSDLQELPPEHLRERLADDLPLQRVHALAERAAQPRVQIRAKLIGHEGRIACWAGRRAG
jgi:hypothetical protein